MWVAQCHVGEEPNKLQQFGDAIGNLGLWQDPMDADRLGNDLTHGHAGIEGGVGILEDHLHLLAHRDHGVPIEPGQIGALEANLTTRWIVEAQYQAPERRLPATRLAGADIYGHIIDGAHLLGRSQKAGPDGEVFLCAPDVEDSSRWLAIDGRLGRRLRVRRWRVERLDLDQAVARRMMIRLSQRQRWIGETLLDGKAAARAKAAARGGVKQVRRCSIDRRKL